MPLLQSLFDGHEKLFGSKRLGNEVVGALFDGVYRQFHGGIACDNDADEIFVFLVQQWKQIDSTTIRQHDVQQDKIERFFIESARKFFDRPYRFDIIALRLESPATGSADARFVVENENFTFTRHIKIFTSVDVEWMDPVTFRYQTGVGWEAIR